MGNLVTLPEAVKKIKKMMEDAIVNGGTVEKTSIIRSQGLIKLIHEAVIEKLESSGINLDYIYPNCGVNTKELKLAGGLKCKNQDVCVLPNDVVRSAEVMNVEGIMHGHNDEYGAILTERILSVNVRSQLSSLAKNIDTLYERTFAESLNLHLRCENMVLGEVYMIAVKEYDTAASDENRVVYKDNPNISGVIEKYIRAFGALNGRKDKNDAIYKYEKVCLLIVDFSKRVPMIYSSTQELVNDGLLPVGTQLRMEDLNFDEFVSGLLEVYEKRFGKGKFI